MSKYNIFFAVFFFSVFVSSMSQILLKKSANKTYDSKIKEYLNPFVIIAYGMFFCSMILTMVAYKGVPLNFGPAIEATGYVYIAILSVMILKEKITRKKIIGNILIVVGVIVYSGFGLN